MRPTGFTPAETEEVLKRFCKNHSSVSEELFAARCKEVHQLTKGHPLTVSLVGALVCTREDRLAGRAAILLLVLLLSSLLLPVS